MTELPSPDPLFHQPVRTRLAVLLSREEVSFMELKQRLEITDGNLDAHLKKFAAAGFLHSQTILKGRSNTVYHLSPSGMAAFKDYQRVVKQLMDAAG